MPPKAKVSDKVKGKLPRKFSSSSDSSSSDSSSSSSDSDSDSDSEDAPKSRPTLLDKILLTVENSERLDAS